MSALGNKEVFSQNLKYYIEQSGKDRRELAEIWGFPYSTVSEWINAKKYPRIDRIEIMANYFGIQKSDLIEKKVSEEAQAKNTVAVNVVLRLREDPDFYETVKLLYRLEAKQLGGVKAMLESMLG